MVEVRGKVRAKESNLFQSFGVPSREADYEADTVIFAQGENCTTVLFIVDGTIKLSVVSPKGKEAVVALLKPGDFLGEGCLAGQARRMSTATAATAATVLALAKEEMLEQLHANVAFADRFLTHMLTRNIRIEEDLVDLLFNSSEKRLARALLLLARYGESDQPQRVLPHMSHELLAEMIGATRSRVSVFMNKFRRMGLIEYKNGVVKVDSSLISVVLHERD